MSAAILLLGELALATTALAMPSEASLPAPAVERTAEDPAGTWHVWLDSPGGKLPFELEIEGEAGSYTSWIVNGTERIEVPQTRLEGETLTLSMPHYDSRIEARLGEDTLEGLWTKRRSLETWTEMSFHGMRGKMRRFEPFTGRAPGYSGGDLDGRWRVQFDSSDDPAVGVFETLSNGTTMGTFLTTTGDYRYLAGSFQNGRLRLSCFDGAHAFLFDAFVREVDELAGHFWSRDTWHEKWTAVRDPEASLPDAFDEVLWREEWSLVDCVFPDLEGVPRTLADPEFAGRAMLLQVFGSWCPNCHDEARYLVELNERYGERGLSIVGLAFELTGDFERDAAQVKRWKEHVGVDWPILVSGLANKEMAARAFPALSRVKSYPTTLFLDSAGNVRRVHSGFQGPAAGEAHQHLRREFEAEIEGLLAEEEASNRAAWEFLAKTPWSHAQGSKEWELRVETGRDGRPTLAGERVADPRGVAVRQNALYLSARGVRAWPDGPSEVYRLDPRAGVLQAPLDFGDRYLPTGRDRAPILEGRELDSTDGVLALFADPDPLVRRETLAALSVHRMRAELARQADYDTLLEDEDPRVRAAACYAAGAFEDRARSDALLERLSDPTSLVRREALAALVRLGAHAVAEPDERLLEAVRDPDPLIRRVAGELAQRAPR